MKRTTNRKITRLALSIKLDSSIETTQQARKQALPFLNDLFPIKISHQILTLKLRV